MKKQNNNGFTLVEIVVSVAIFSIIMVSIVSLYILSTSTSLKSDINRIMHENIKSAITEIGEDIIKNGISGVSIGVGEGCNFDLNSKFYLDGTKLCTNIGNKYFLAKKEIDGNYTRVENIKCEDLKDQCYIAKMLGDNSIAPLTNSLVSIKNLEFYISDTNVNKATILIELQPTIKAGVKPSLIKENKLFFQTTISERPF